MQPVSEAAVGVAGEGAWALLLMLAARASRGVPLREPVGVWLRGASCPQLVGPAAGQLTVYPDGSFRARAAVAADARQLLELLLPVCVGPDADRLVVAHLGQSLDGRISTPTGDSQFITGEQDLAHTHRLRALFDAVVVGASTVEFDDPQLTTRRVPGQHPVRVALDPRGRIAPQRRILSDGQAPTLIVRRQGTRGAVGRASVLPVPSDTDGDFDVHALLAALAGRGLRRVFVEGGGVTVSRFLRAGALHRLHLAVAPVIIGSGASALNRVPIESLADALRVPARRFDLGPDVLFDCDLRGACG